MEPLPPDPYIALGVDRNAEVSTIKSAYRKLVLKCHPDKVQDPALKAIKQDEFQRVQQAYEILGDDTRRKDYDDQVKLKKLREEVYKNMSHHSSPRTPPRHYEFNVNIRTAEPPASFRSGAPSAPQSPYAGGNPQFSSSWDRDIPSRSKPVYDEERRARRAASYEKPRKEDEPREVRKQRKEADEPLPKEKRRPEREREREREREKEPKDRERDNKRRDRELAEQKRDEDRDRELRKAEEKRAKKDREKRDKERDKQRRQDQEERLRAKKAPYVEHHDLSDDESRAVKKKSSSSSNKKHAESPRPREREKSSRREASPAIEPAVHEKVAINLKAAAEYMHHARRKGSKSGSSGHFSEQPGGYSEQFPDPEFAWHAEPPRSRRSSNDDRKFHASVEEAPEVVSVSPDRPPRLQKSFTSPPGTMHMPNTSAQRAPQFARAQTMDFRAPPQAPAAPEVRHPHKSERRRRGSVDPYEEEPRSRHSRPHHQPNVIRYNEEDFRHLRPSEDSYYTGGRGGASFNKVKVAPAWEVYQGKEFDPQDVQWSNVSHSSPHSGGAFQYSHAHAPYVAS